MALKDIFPPIETALEMEPEELGPLVLKYLATQGENINRYNMTLPGGLPDLGQYAGRHADAFRERLMEAWMWLEKEIFVVPRPGQTGDWAMITRRGRQLLEAQDFSTYRHEAALRGVKLDPVLVRKVKPAFLRGDYDSAVFEAFKEVEVRVRKKAKFPNSSVGVKLMRAAFSRARSLVIF